MFQTKTLKALLLEALFILTCFQKIAAQSPFNDTTEFQQNHYDTGEFLKWDDYYFEESFAFFSSDFAARLMEWNATLMNASRHCGKLELSGIDLTINFAAFDGNIDPEDYFLTFENLLPVLVRKKSGHDLARIAYMSILELWPVLILCFSFAVLFGMFIWLLDTRSNSEQFPTIFWRGLLESIWWSVVTMTTVGYGDKAPKSLLARLFATVWMIAGIILLSMFTAQMTSRLMTQEITSGNHLFGKMIGVPRALYESDYVDYKMTFSIVEEINNPMDAKNLTGEQRRLDSVVVFHCDDKEFENSLEVLQFLPPCGVGAALTYTAHDPFYEDWDFKLIENHAKCMKTHIRVARERSNKTKKSHSCKGYLEKGRSLHFEFKWVYFKDLSQYLIPFGSVVGILLLALLIGTIWDCFCKKKKDDFNIRRSASACELQVFSTEQDSPMLQMLTTSEDKPETAETPSDLEATVSVVTK